MKAEPVRCEGQSPACSDSPQQGNHRQMATGSKILPKETPVQALLSKQIFCTQEHENHMEKIIVICSRKELIFKAELEFLRPWATAVLRHCGPNVL